MRISTFVPAKLGAALVVLLIVGFSAAEERVPMTNELLEELLKKEFGAEQVVGRLGAWQINLPEDDEEKETDDEEIGDIGCQPQPIDRAKDKEDEEEGNAEEDKAGDEKLEEDQEKKKEPSDDESDKEAEDGNLLELDEGDRIPAVMIVLTDTNANRMRLMMPIRKFDPTTKREDLQLALIVLHANFDRALDARYATQNGMLWSAFIHPLESLTAKDLKNGLDQVRALRKNTGTTFTSSELLFGGAALNAP